jgi:hypothetical protein
LISPFPYLVLLPGLIFIVVGLWYLRRARLLNNGTDLGTRLAKANRSLGNTTMLFGAMLVIVAIPLMIAIRQLNP